MNEETLKDIIRACNQKNDYSELTTKLPYETRYSLFIGDVDRRYMQFLYYTMLEYLFTQEEAEILYNQLEDTNKKADLVILLGEQTKMSLLESIELDGYQSIKFIKSLKEQQNKYKAAEHFLKNHIISTYQIKELVETFDSEYQMQIVDKIIEYYNKDPYKITEYNYVDIITNFDENNRLTAFKTLIEKSGNSEFSYTYISKILEIMPNNERKECLSYLLDKFNDKYLKTFYMVEDILNIFKDEEFYDILKLILDKGLLDQYAISNMFKKYPIEKCLELADYLIEYGKNNNRKLMSDYAIATILDRVPKTEGIKIYQKYAIDTAGFGNLNIALNCKEVEDRYFYIDYLLGQVTPKSFDDAYRTIDTVLSEMHKTASGIYDYPNIINMYAQKWQVDKNNLRTLTRHFNYTTFRFMVSKNVRALLNLPEQDLIKFINLFDPNTKNNNISNDRQTLDINTINTICNSLLQREFRLTNDNDYTIFSQFEELLASKNEDTAIKVTELLATMKEVIDIHSTLNNKGITIDTFVYNLLHDDKDSIDILHELTQEYIMKKREIFVKEKLETIYDEIGVEKKIEKSFYKKKLLELYSEFDINWLFKSIPIEYISEEEKELLSDRALLDRLTKFKKNHTPLENPSEKKYLKLYESLLNKAYEYKYTEEKLNDLENIPYSYFPITPTDDWLLGIVADCNIQQIVEKLLNNEKQLNDLRAFIDKYKLFAWGKTFANLELRADLELTESTIASIISNFYIINPIAIEKNANLTQFIDYANCYNSVSKTYANILERDNYRAIAANEGKNKANMSKAERLNRIPNLIRDMYGKDGVTLPPIDKDYTTTSGKKLNVVLGNSTNMINLSYGERTNSCLRIGGAFNNLFEFCLRDKNGFHVRFTDPTTKKFISRVSGIRNGNTIFFNELRDSENPNYTNEEVVEVLKTLSDELVKQTQDEECPIENVVITYDHAMSEYENQAIPTELSQYPNAFFGNNFNIKLDGTFVLLQSTDPEKKLRPYIFGEDLPRIYETQRDKVVTIEDLEKAEEKVTQLHLIDEILKGTEVDELPIVNLPEITLCIAGEDWYIYQDQLGNIHQFLMENTKHRDRALNELKAALEQIKSYVDTKSDEKKIGG